MEKRIGLESVMDRLLKRTEIVEEKRPVDFVRVKRGKDGGAVTESAEGSSALPEKMDRVRAMRAGKLALTRSEFESFQQMTPPEQAAFSVKKLREQARVLERLDASAVRKSKKVARKSSRAARKKQRAAR